MTQSPPPGQDPNQPGYQPPAQPGYSPPPPGYHAAPAPPPPGFNSSEERIWAMVATFGAAAGSLISFGVLSALGPLIAYLAKGKEPGVRRYALPALNFFLPFSGAALVLIVVRTCAGLALGGAFGSLVSSLLWLVGAVVWLGGIAFGVLAGLKANEGQDYRYPYAQEFVK